MPPLTDRPHTISSAYSGGHQRPSLQPYTFHSPDKAAIPEEEEGEAGGAARPPVPQRYTRGEQERPVLPTQTEATILTKQQLVHSSGVPSFSCTQPDMVVPQPVYMNMEDLASLREEEEGLDLKTPTQEDQAGLASCSTSDGSSSGYGSQSTVDTGYSDGEWRVVCEVACSVSPSTRGSHSEICALPYPCKAAYVTTQRYL